MSWQTEYSKDWMSKFFLFLISPFLGFLYSLKRINTKSSFLVFFLFSVFFGLNFTTSDGKDEFHSGDAAAYRMKFNQAKTLTQGELFDYYHEVLLMENEKQRDIYVPLMSYITTFISDSYHVFFAFLAIVFSFFMLSSFKFFSDDLTLRKTFPIWILLWMFVMTNSIFNINGCRFWTAAWIAVFCMFQIYRNGNKRYYLLACITPLVHQSYFFFLVILLLITLLGNRTSFWKVIFYLSFVVSSLSMQLMVDFSDYLPSALQFLVARYTEGDIVLKTNLYQVIHRFFDLGWTILLVVMMYRLMKHEQEISNNPKIAGLYKLLLVWMSICNFVMPIPSLGARYITLGLPILAYVWYHAFTTRGRYNGVLKFYPIVGIMGGYDLLYCYVSQSVPMSFYYTSPIYQFYKYIIQGVL